MGSTYSQILFHVVFSTKGRAPLINSEIKNHLYKYIGGIISGEGAILLEIGGMPDHVHLVIRSRPSILFSDLMRKIKGSSSKWLNERSASEKFQWQDGYGVFSVSSSQLDNVVRYVKNQERHHAKQSFKEELIEFLKKQEIEYDEAYLWS